MADVNGDMILDLIVGTGAGVSPEVAVYSGADTPDGPFKTELARFAPFDADFTGGVNVAGADIDGNAMADNIIVASGPGVESQVKVFSARRPRLRTCSPRSRRIPARNPVSPWRPGWSISPRAGKASSPSPGRETRHR
jgi:hypothetical protein